MPKKINVTKTFLPPLERYSQMLKPLWENHHITNNGVYVQELEETLKNYLNVPYLSYVSNGTMALQIALSALGIDEGEVITTPFSYVATASSILWERCTPVFVDIEQRSLCMNPTLIEQRITEKTRAIMPVHVFGTPCDVEEIEKTAKKHGLHIIYDAAHAFGSSYKGRSLLDYGDITTCSFHATKLFHTVEGGAIISHDKSIADKIDLQRRFGHNNDEHICLGINAKNSEFHAAMGLANFPYLDEIIKERKKISEYYNERLSPFVARPVQPEDLDYNYAYYPIITKDEAQTLAIITALNEQNIYPRRYFYPSLNEIGYINGERCPVSESVAKRILCLPLFVGLSPEDQQRICNIIIQTIEDI